MTLAEFSAFSQHYADKTPSDRFAGKLNEDEVSELLYWMDD